MFTNEDEWAAAYEAAVSEMELLVASGLVVLTDGATIRGIATRIASTAIRAGCDDISSVPGVKIEQVPVYESRDSDRVPEIRSYLAKNRATVMWDQAV